MDEEKDVLESETEQTNSEEVKHDPSDNLTPEHPRFKEVVAEKNELKQTVTDLQTQIDDLKQSISTKQDTGEETDEEEVALRKIEKRMEGKFAKVEDVDSERQALTFDRLSDKYNGSNGYPRFVPVDVVAYARTKGYGKNYEAAYNDMHREAIVQVEVKKLNTSKAPTSEKPSGGDKQAEGDTISATDIANMSDEEYEKNRTKILQAVRPK